MCLFRINTSVIKYNIINLGKSINSKEMEKNTANTRKVESILWYFQVFLILEKAWNKPDVEHAIVMAGEWAGSLRSLQFLLCERWFSSEA